MVEAAFRLDALKKFSCGRAATRDDRIVVDVHVLPRFAADESCGSGVFSIYRDGQPTNTDAVLRLTIGSGDRQTWQFHAAYFDPPNSPNDHLASAGSEEIHFENINYYCVFGFGRLARSNAGWRAWVEPAR